MLASLRSSLVFSLLSVGAVSALATGCSGGDFNVSNTTGDAGTAGGDTGASGGDTGASADADGVPTADTGAANEGGSVDGAGTADVSSGDALIGGEVRPLDAGCAAPEPTLACVAPVGPYYEQYNYYGGSWLTPRLGLKGAIAISYELKEDGRHEKLILRLRTIEVNAAGQTGRLTLTAFRTPCPGHHVPLGKASIMQVNVAADGYDYPFYFNTAETELPSFPQGTRLTFVLTSDSTRYAFDLSGNPTPPDAPPQGMQWFHRADTASGGWIQGVGIASARPWMRDCLP